MLDTNLPRAYPLRYRVVRREGDTWFLQELGEIFYNPSGQHVADPNDIEALFGIRLSKVCVELWRINGGQPGWYLVDLRDRCYWYCGKSEQDVTNKFHELGVGRPDPQVLKS